MLTTSPLRCATARRPTRPTDAAHVARTCTESWLSSSDASASSTGVDGEPLSPSAKAAFFRAHLWQKGELAAASATASTASGPAATMAWVAARRTDSRSETNASCEQGGLAETQSGKRHREVVVGSHLQDGQGLGAQGGEVVARRCGPTHSC